MALTLRDLAAERSLGLRVLAGEAALDRPIGWVHPTELIDPQAFLEGGELLLTTGLALDERTSPAYVRGLVDAGVAGVGFGVGLSHGQVPRALAGTAAEVGLPLLEVPKRTPFIAITRAVSRAVAADEYAALVRTGRGQQELTRTAVGKSGVGGVVRKLARLVDGWVVLFDASGTVTEAAPASARGHVEGLRGELEHLRAGTRLTVLGEYEVALQTLDTRTRGVLAVGTEGPLDTAGQHIVNTAVSLLSLALEQNRAQSAALRDLRTGLVELLAQRQNALALGVMTTVWGGAPEPPWSVLAFVGPPAARRALHDTLDADTVAEDVFFAHSGSAVLVFGAARQEDQVLAAAARIGGLHGGLVEQVSLVDFATVAEQATHAASSAQEQRVPLVRYAEHVGAGLLELVEPGVAQAFAARALTPLRRHDETGRGDLVESLRCWLEHHGHWDNAATRLGVHRHTLRNRMRKVEELTGRSLDSPGVRAELWLALQLG
ncbi:PucR family transcriptional regulator [Amycolatopsis sp. NPDC058986]|uniref:PucR family transcriptional regulator n=1 Tax=unclassified Amycolatopsis TaxID=2618356 RepID=UPI00366DA5D3